MDLVAAKFQPLIQLPWQFQVWPVLAITGPLNSGKVKVGQDRDFFIGARRVAMWHGCWVTIASMIQFQAPKIEVAIKAYWIYEKQVGWTDWSMATVFSGCAWPPLGMCLLFVGPLFQEVVGKATYVPFALGDQIVFVLCYVLELICMVMARLVEFLLRLSGALAYDVFARCLGPPENTLENTRRFLNSGVRSDLGIPRSHQ